MIKILLVVFIAQMIISSIYSLICIARELEFFLIAKYGENWKADETSEEDIDMCVRVIRKTFFPIFNETMKIFALSNLVIVIIVKIML